MSMSATRQSKIMLPLPEDLAADGNAEDFRVTVTQILMASGDSIEPPDRGITVVVGGNNAGKSTFLRDIWTKLSRPAYSVYKPLLIEEVGLSRNGTDSDVFAWFTQNVPWSGLNSRSGFLTENGVATTVNALKKFCKEGNSLHSIVEIASHIVQRGDLHKRLDVVKPVDQREDPLSPPTHPLHRMQDDPALLDLIQELSERIFRQRLTIDRLGGTSIASWLA
jgi:hypothetical protein